MENNEKYRKTVLTGIYPFMWVKMPNTSREMMIYGGKRLNSTCFVVFHRIFARKEGYKGWGSEKNPPTPSGKLPIWADTVPTSIGDPLWVFPHPFWRMGSGGRGS